MASGRDLRRRIRSIGNTAQITKAMQMVAASKMRKAQQAAINVRPFSQLLYRIQRLAAQGAPGALRPSHALPYPTQRLAATRATDFKHPLLQRRDVQRRAIVLVASD